MPAKKLDLVYLKQDCQLTLRDGLQEYYAQNPTFLNFESTFLGMDKDTVKAHDVAHVIFGCGTTSADELIVETWTLFGCKIPLRKYTQMTKDGLPNEVLKMFGPYRLIKRLFLTFPRVILTLWTCLTLKKRWITLIILPF